MGKSINVNLLQSQISKIIKSAEKGEIFEIIRYSKPVAVLMSFDEYNKLKGDCHECVQELRKLVK